MTDGDAGADRTSLRKGAPRRRGIGQRLGGPFANGSACAWRATSRRAAAGQWPAAVHDTGAAAGSSTAAMTMATAGAPQSTHSQVSCASRSSPCPASGASCAAPRCAACAACASVAAAGGAWAVPPQAWMGAGDNVTTALHSAGNRSRRAQRRRRSSISYSTRFGSARATAAAIPSARRPRYHSG